MLDKFFDKVFETIIVRVMFGIFLTAIAWIYYYLTSYVIHTLLSSLSLKIFGYAGAIILYLTLFWLIGWLIDKFLMKD